MTTRAAVRRKFQFVLVRQPYDDLGRVCAAQVDAPQASPNAFKDSSMLSFNDRIFASGPEEARACAENGMTHHGFYERHVVNGVHRGYRLYSDSGTLRAYVGSNEPHFKGVVTASMDDHAGRPRYMYGLSSVDAQWLGLPENGLLREEVAAIESMREFEPSFRLMLVENPNRDDLDQTPVQRVIWGSSLEAAIERAASDYPGCRVIGLEDGRGGDITSFSVSWRRRDVHCSIPGVSWWRDEASPNDPYILRVLYASDGRKLGGPMVGEPGEMRDWCVVPGSVVFAQDLKASPSEQEAEQAGGLFL